MATRPRILLACIGNIFLGDDGFGVEVARGLGRREWPENVRLADFGIRGFDLAYALMDDYDVIVFVDAAPRGEEPGTLFVIEPDLRELGEPDGQVMLMDGHTMNPLRILQLARSMGARLNRVLLVGCEPATLGPAEGKLGLSAPVEAAAQEAVPLIESLVSELSSGSRATTITTNQEGGSYGKTRDAQRLCR